MNDLVRCMLPFDDGSGEFLWVGGRFTMAGDIPALRLAKWDGSSWSTPSEGMNSVVTCLATFDDGLGGGPALYAGGVFTEADGAPANRIAKWTGSGWVAVGGGLTASGAASVSAMQVFDDGQGGGPALHVGGLFTHADGKPAKNIARWNGTEWSNVGNGFNLRVNALCVYDDGLGEGPALYAGGQFDGHIARWDAPGWSTVGGGVSSTVTSFAVFDEGGGDQPALFAGGFFLTAGGISAPHIARWGGVVWSALPAPTPQWPVLAMVTAPSSASGEPVLYMGGGPWVEGPLHHIASWSGSTWDDLGSGLDGTQNGMIVYDDGSGAGPALFTGGLMSAVWDGEPFVNNIARWGPSMPGEVIDGAYLGLFLANWGNLASGMDFNGDGAVDGGDLGILLSWWGCVGCAPPLNNNFCVNAHLIFDGDTSFSTIGATTDGPPLSAGCLQFDPPQFVSDIWYNYVATCTGTLTISTCNQAGFDTRLAAYAGCECPSSELLDCNDDLQPTCDLTSLLQFDVVAGDQIKIRVGGFESSGTGTLTITCSPQSGCPASDHDCFSSGGPGCIDVECCNPVCAFDFFCCLVAWDQICIDAALLLCSVMGQPVEPICTNFNGQSLAGWTLYGLNKYSNGVYFAAPGPSGSSSDYYFNSVDSGGDSYFFAPGPYLGDWSILDDGASCGGLEWDVRIFADASPLTVPHYPAVYISNDPDGDHYFGFFPATIAAVFTAFDPISETTGWRHVSAPIGPLKFGVLPQSTQGEWTMTLGTIADWDTLIQNVTELHFWNDWVNGPGENVGYDNICLTNTTCPCVVVNNQGLECADDGTGDFYWSFSVYNYSGATAEHILLTPQISGTSVVPNIINTTLLDGQGAGIFVKLIGGHTTSPNPVTITLLDSTMQECCSMDLILHLPDC